MALAAWSYACYLTNCLVMIVSVARTLRLQGFAFLTAGFKDNLDVWQAFSKLLITGF